MVQGISHDTPLASGDFSGHLLGCFGTMAAMRHVCHLPVPKEFNFPPFVVDRTNYKGHDAPGCVQRHHGEVTRSN